MAVYPRWRGEHGAVVELVEPDFGLSPLARGTPPLLRPPKHNRRFIPAGAGNTQVNILRSHIASVYPRWRGEHITRLCSYLKQSGLSPLARGTLFNQFFVGESGRFIPAGAGNTIRQKGGLHPFPGLSPLARGTHIIVSVDAK